MTDKPKTCSNCAYKSDGLNTLTPDYCYCHDMTVEQEGICDEWRGSLRTEPLNKPPLKEVKE
jgi:hypothetical protein